MKSWTSGVEVEWEAVQQLRNIAALPILAGHVAVMPDVHVGKGATVGSVIPTKAAIIPSAVGTTRNGRVVLAQTIIDLQGSLDTEDLGSAWKGIKITARVLNALDKETPFAEVGQIESQGIQLPTP